jgi:hypothetical protein
LLVSQRIVDVDRKHRSAIRTELQRGLFLKRLAQLFGGFDNVDARRIIVKVKRRTLPGVLLRRGKADHGQEDPIRTTSIHGGLRSKSHAPSKA